MNSMIPLSKYNILVFKGTTMTVKLGHYIDFHNQYHDISEKIEKSISETVTIPENKSFDEDLAASLNLRAAYGNREKQIISTRIDITHESTAAAARRYKNQNYVKICALNFANGFQPGGGVLRGCPAQEETLCRQSNLYFCLKDQTEMYDFNKERGNKFCSHYMLYSPEVVFFRDDDYEYCRPIRISIITSPAIDCRTFTPSEQTRQEVNRVTKNRLRKVLQLAMRTDNKVIILGAFGCGAFANIPEDVANIFKELIVDEFYGMFFDKIVFPIYGDPDQPDRNYDAFVAAFQ